MVVHFHGSIESWQGFKAVARIIETCAERLLLVSMREVDCINCAGLGKMMAMSFIAKELGKKVCFADLRPCVKQAFESLNGHHFVNVYDSEQEALADSGPHEVQQWTPPASGCAAASALRAVVG